MPPPAVLQDFEDRVPGAAGLILREFEAEAVHRRTREMRELDILGRDMITGQVLAIIFAVGALMVAAFAVYRGQQWIGSIVGGGTIVAVVVAFLRHRQGDE